MLRLRRGETGMMMMTAATQDYYGPFNRKIPVISPVVIFAAMPDELFRLQEDQSKKRAKPTGHVNV